MRSRSSRARRSSARPATASSRYPTMTWSRSSSSGRTRGSGRRASPATRCRAGRGRAASRATTSATGGARPCSGSASAPIRASRSPRPRPSARAARTSAAWLRGSRASRRAASSRRSASASARRPRAARPPSSRCARGAVSSRSRSRPSSARRRATSMARPSIASSRTACSTSVRTAISPRRRGHGCSRTRSPRTSSALRPLRLTPWRARDTPRGIRSGVRGMSGLSRTHAPMLTQRQAQVLSALVNAYVGEAAPVASETVAALLPVRLSPASVRNTLAELHELGLLEKPHRSAGRIPTELGLRAFVTRLPERELPPYQKRELEDWLGADGGAEVASRVLTARTRQLGFVLPPRLDGVVLRNVSLVRISSERVLAVLVAAGGRVLRRVLEQPGRSDQAELDRMAGALRERVIGRTLRAVRDQLLAEAAALRSQADLLLERVLRALPQGEGADAVDLVIGTHLALLDQPEFRDPQRIRGLLEAVEERERLVYVVSHMLDGERPHVAFGGDLGDPALAHLALVAAPYAGEGGGVGSVGVIGLARMDYARVIPLVGYVSRLLGGSRDA